MITIIDYDAGNIGSITNMLKKIGIQSQVSGCKTDLVNSDILILPGVGSFDYGMSRLRKKDLIGPILTHALEYKRPILGICLGLQLFCNGSEEGSSEGLNLINTTVKKFEDPLNNFRIPHMGWNYVKSESPVFANIDEPRFYFVHSYYVPGNIKESIGSTTYCNMNFSSAIQKKNIFGYQFHPEKSNMNGFNLLKNTFSEFY